ncbi:MAG: haloacid dehalogenase [Chloroflexi bacterium]|nr:haloacid dehalogenase [Chloroflexota bacterium]
MNEATPRWEEIGEALRAALSAKSQAREEALGLCRATIQGSSKAIRAIHRREFDLAAQILADVAASLRRAEAALENHPDLRYGGFVLDAQKEYAEARLTKACVAGHPMPTPEEIGVAPAAYLNGLGEAVGELRRYILDSLRRGEFADIERLLATMDDIYSLLTTMDYPDALTNNLRRTTDAARGVLERTRGDVTLACLQRDLGTRVGTAHRELDAGAR